MKISLKEFRLLVRKIINEYVANTDGDPHKEDHADPTGKAWDAGLDEADEDHEDDPRWDNHADPTGKEWHSGLDDAKG